jgi:hypothetical protein
MATRKQKRDIALLGGTTLLWVAVAVVSGGVWPIVAAAGFGTATTFSVLAAKPKRRRPMPPKARKAPRKRVERPIGQGLPKRAPLVAPAAPKRVGTRACSAACQRSTKPAHTCDCSCGGRSHGAMVKGTRASLLTAEARRAERDAKRRGPVQAVPPQRPAVSARAATPAKVGAPSRREVPLRSPDERRGWKSLQTLGKQAMAAHAKASPRCSKGSVTARTVRDRRTSPPTVTQSLTCDTCGAALT